MKLVFQTLGILFILIGLSFLFAPTFVLDWLEANNSSTAVYASAIIARLVLGGLLVLAAKDSRFPILIQIFGYLLIVVALVFVVIGQQSFQQLITSIIPAVKPYARFTGLLVITFGGFFVYAFSGKAH